MEEQKEKKKSKLQLMPVMKWCVAGAVVIIVLIVGVLVLGTFGKKNEMEVITKTTLEKIVNVSELSTYEVIYNGVAKVMNEKKPEKVDYYVAYEAKVKAGIDFEQIDIAVDDEAKKISVTLPEVKITDTEVKAESLEYIFENDKANTETVSQQAYKECKKDVENECASKDAIYELAKQNGKNVVEALISPFVKQLDEEYELEIK